MVAGGAGPASRTFAREISAIETGRLVRSTAAALSLARSLDRSVESLFRLPEREREQVAWAWTCEPPFASGRFWRAEVGGCALLYPVEVSPLGLLPHDGTFGDQGLDFHPCDDSLRTLVLASCDLAVGLLHVRRKRYEICSLESLAEDPRLEPLSGVVRSGHYRRSLGELPGYDVSHTGELSRFSSPGK